MSSLFIRDVVIPQLGTTAVGLGRSDSGGRGPGSGEGNADRGRVDVLVRDGVITEIGPDLRPEGEVEVVDGDGGALLPGLYDHHIHLLATAAARESAAVGPPDVTDARGLAEALRRADAALPAGRWLRAVGYHESVAGELDRDRLDALVPGRPVRLQHRTGVLWVLNSPAIAALRLETPVPDHPGIERDGLGRLTGRFLRADDWLRDRLRRDGRDQAPDLAGLGAELARYGITGLTDATPFTDLTGPALLASARAEGVLPQRVTVMGGIELVDTDLPEPLGQGPVKLVIDDDQPTFDVLVAHIRRAHRCGRPVAVHCVTRAALVLLLAAWDEAGSRPGDRIEHGSVIPEELIPRIRGHGLTAVTQPALVAERGDRYLADVDPDDVPHLYRARSLVTAGIGLAASSDAPYTSPDPWAAMRATVARRTPSGATLGPDEAVTVEQALALYLGAADSPAHDVRRLEVGAPADLCLLAGPVPAQAADLRSDQVAATVVAGRRIS